MTQYLNVNIGILPSRFWLSRKRATESYSERAVLAPSRTCLAVRRWRERNYPPSRDFLGERRARTNRANQILTSGLKFINFENFFTQNRILLNPKSEATIQSKEK